MPKTIAWLLKRAFALALLLVPAGLVYPVQAAQPGRMKILKSPTAQISFVAQPGSRCDSLTSRLDHNGNWRIKISHRRGIGSVTFRLRQGAWPESLEVAFEGFSCLENVTICSGGKSLVTSSKVPGWRDYAGCGAAGPKITMTNEGEAIVFRLQGPLASSRSLTLSWIDFYRN